VLCDKVVTMRGMVGVVKDEHTFSSIFTKSTPQNPTARGGGGGGGVFPPFEGGLFPPFSAAPSFGGVSFGLNQILRVSR
jgi:hypothetical protein